MRYSETYLVFPGPGRSSPRQPLVHLLGRSLANLYGVPFSDCIVIPEHIVEPHLLRLADAPGYIHLHPREDGLYPPALPKEYRMSRCIITGCALISPQDGDLHAWGDLHEQGDQYIFNACLGEDGEPRWIEDALPPGQKIIQLLDPVQHFQRRGVIVMAKRACELNPAAEAYVHG